MDSTATVGSTRFSPHGKRLACKLTASAAAAPPVNADWTKYVPHQEVLVERIRSPLSVGPICMPLFARQIGVSLTRKGLTGRGVDYTLYVAGVQR